MLGISVTNLNWKIGSLSFIGWQLFSYWGCIIVHLQYRKNVWICLYSWLYWSRLLIACSIPASLLHGNGKEKWLHRLIWKLKILMLLIVGYHYIMQFSVTKTVFKSQLCCTIYFLWTSIVVRVISLKFLLCSDTLVIPRQRNLQSFIHEWYRRIAGDVFIYKSSGSCISRSRPEIVSLKQLFILALVAVRKTPIFA